MSDPRHQLGQRAESAVAGWLVGEGWTILDRRWRSRFGELDLVCLDRGGVLVGVEVKLRSTGRAGTGPESIDARRLGRLRRALADYAAANRPPARGLRLDLVTLSPGAAGAWRLRRLPDIDGW